MASEAYKKLQPWRKTGTRSTTTTTANEDHEVLEHHDDTLAQQLKP